MEAVPELRRATLGRKLALAAGSTLVALVVAEIALRIWFPVEGLGRIAPEGHPWARLMHQPSQVPGLSYEMRPGAEGDAIGVHITINSLGMRGHEPRQPKSMQLLRVVTLGDSVAFGWGVEQERIFPARLESLLNDVAARRRDYEVLDLAVTSYCTREEAVVLEHKGLPLDPDLVLVAYYLNDPDFNPINALRMTYHKPEWWEHSELLRFCAHEKHQWKEHHYGGGDYFRWLHNTATEEWRSVPEGFAKIHALADTKAIRVVVVLFPTFKNYGAWSEYPYAELHAQVRRAAEAERFVVLDLLDVFRGSGRTREELMRDPDHPNALGHELAAEALRDLFVARHRELFGADL